MRNLLILIVILSLGCEYSFSQRTQEELKDFISKADEKTLVSENCNEMINGQFYNAGLIVDKLLELKPNSNNYLYRKGYINSELGKSPQDVLTYLNKVDKSKLTKSFDMFSTADNASVDVYYYIGLAHQRLENNDSSIYYFQQYLDRSNKSSYLYTDAQNRIGQNRNAKNQIEKKDKDIRVINLGDKINTEYPEYGSVILDDNKTILFTSRRPWENDLNEPFLDTRTGLYPEDIYSSKLDGADWTGTKRLAMNNLMYNDAIVSIYRDTAGEDNTVFVYSDSLGRGDVMLTQSKLNDKGELVKSSELNIGGVNAKKYWEPSLFMTPDGKRVYFSSTRKGGYGGLDLYYTDLNSDGTWGKPVNLGPSINTPSDEDAPVLTVDGKYLVYASNNPRSMGGYDLFASQITSSNQFAEGKPLSYPINSTADDIFYNYSADGLEGYVTSNRIDSYGDKDIYKVDFNYLGLEKVRYAIIALKNDNGANLTNEKVRITCINCADNNAPVVYSPREDGKIVKALEPCHNYQVEYLKDDEVESKDTIASDCNLAYQHITYDHVYGLKKVEEEDVTPKATEVLLAEYQKNFGYNLNKSDKNNKEFKEAINKAKKLLKEDSNALVMIEIYSSASSVPTKKYVTNENLAQLRANNMMKMIVDEFKNDESSFSRTNVSVKDSSVNGPTYNDDAKNASKYAPYQYVKIKVFKK